MFLCVLHIILQAKGCAQVLDVIVFVFVPCVLRRKRGRQSRGTAITSAPTRTRLGNREEAWATAAADASGSHTTMSSREDKAAVQETLDGTLALLLRNETYGLIMLRPSPLRDIPASEHRT